MSTWRPLMSCRSVKRETKDDMPGMGWQESRVFLCHTDVPTSHLPPQWATVLTSAFCFTPQAGCHLPPRPSSLLQFSGSGEFLDWFANMDVDISHRKGQWYKSQCVHYAFRNTHTHPTHTHTGYTDTFIFTQSFPVTLTALWKWPSMWILLITILNITLIFYSHQPQFWIIQTRVSLARSSPRLVFFFFSSRKNFLCLVHSVLLNSQQGADGRCSNRRTFSVE